ncbi:MAG: S-formylglutathione hydrolase [Alphaproteobacteria bacterium]
MDIETIGESRCFGGIQGVYRHASSTTGTPMRFALYRPPQAEKGPVPVLFWLSGLTCTEENFTVKAGAQRYAAEHGVMLVAPDTSPRGSDVPNDDAYDLGQGAGFYVDATEAPWSAHFRMYSYVVDELPALIAANFPADTDRQGIFGHSMGGHGALVAALRNPDRFRSVSALAPIAAPMQSAWGEKVLTAYLGADRHAWRPYDSCALIEAGDRPPGPILVDQGDKDEFLDRLRPDLLADVCTAAHVPLDLRMQPGYDHSYFFVASFIGEHIAFHAERLKA